MLKSVFPLLTECKVPQEQTLSVLFLIVSCALRTCLVRGDNVPAALDLSRLWLLAAFEEPLSLTLRCGAPLWSWPRPELAPSAPREVWREKHWREPGLRAVLSDRRGFRVGAGSVGPAASGRLQGLMRGGAPSGLPECLGWVPQRVRDEDGWVSGMGGGTWRNFVSS